MTYWIAPFIPFSILLLSGCWETTQCLTGPDEAATRCRWEEQNRKHAGEDCNRQRPRQKEEQVPDYQRY